MGEGKAGELNRILHLVVVSAYNGADYSSYVDRLLIEPVFFWRKYMLCLRPKVLYNLPRKEFPLGLMVACGSCIVCRKQRAREWALRLEHEKLYSCFEIFTTLTYEQKYVPKCYSVIMCDVQYFFKRLRKNTKSKIKYYAVGEYGGKFGRPHYHMLLYVYDKKYTEEEWMGKYVNGIVLKEGLIREAWPYGFVFNGTVQEGSINYVVEYQDKQIMKHYGVKLNNRRSPFRIMSQGIGEKYLIDNAKELNDNLGVKIRDKIVALPRYYKKKLNIDKKRLIDSGKKLELKAVKKFMKKRKLRQMNANEWYAYYELSKVQRAKNKEAKTALYKRDRLF